MSLSPGIASSAACSEMYYCRNSIATDSVLYATLTTGAFGSFTSIGSDDSSYTFFIMDKQSTILAFLGAGNRVQFWQKLGITWSSFVPTGFSVPGGTVLKGSVSRDGQYWAMMPNNGNRIETYYRDVLTNTFTSLTEDVAIPGNANGVVFSPNGGFLAVGHQSTPFITVYKRVGSGVGASWLKVVNPGTLPAGNGQSIAFSPDGTLVTMGVAGTPTFVTYTVSGSALNILTTPTIVPAATVLGCEFNPEYVAATTYRFAVGYGTTPFCAYYFYDSATTKFVAGTVTGALPLNGSRCTMDKSGGFVYIKYSGAGRRTCSLRDNTLTVGTADTSGTDEYNTIITGTFS